MAELEHAEFQRAAVQLIAERLLDPKGPRRFLLADEVGLGKTIVASGVVHELLRRRPRSELDVVYLCSNAEIAEQNRVRLDPNAGRAIRRVTELAYRAATAPGERDETAARKRLRLYSFTPGTSLSGGTGLAWERRLLLYLVFRVLRQDVRSPVWREFFRCGAGVENWMRDTRFRALSVEFKRKVSRDVQRLVGEEWRKPITVDGGELVPARALAEEVARYRDEPKARRRRNQLVAALRIGVQRVALDDLRPELVILDEVQRFRSVIDDAANLNSIAARLFQNGAAVLILSATPYKMLSLEHEGADHYREFLDTVSFLYGTRGPAEVRELEADLEQFRKRLESGAFVQGHDPELLRLRIAIERRLRKVISRTERNWYIEELHKGVEEVRPDGAAFAVPTAEELTDFVRLRRYLLDKVQTTQHITEYWKSCPAPFTFMDAQYVAMKGARGCAKPVPERLVAPERELPRLSERSLRFRLLFETIFGEPKSRWKYLWTRPTYTYYRDAFFGDADPRKVLAFSGWRFVPKAIALLASNEAEQRIRQHSRCWTDVDPGALRFTEKGSFFVFDVCFPSPVLAQLVDPAALAKEGLTAAQVVRRAEAALEQTLRQAGGQVAETSGSAPWQVVARLERAHGRATFDALRASVGRRSGDITERFGEHVDGFTSWAEGDEPLRVSRDRLRHLAEIAAFSPAVSLLRAIWSVRPEERGTVAAAVVDLCFGALRSYFNKRPVRAIIEDASRGRTYARAVVHYCGLAHFQAVVDEYLYLAKNVLQRATTEDLASHVGRVLGIGTGSPTINVTRRVHGALRFHDKPHVLRSHFALAFGDDVHGEAGSTDDQTTESRKTAIREAFNSPFWPFVLATTSAGQEGLDFHLFCRDIVHWNLPSNPVDLEQREGRINRRDGLALRRSIAQDWPLDRVAALAPDAGENLWGRVFRSIAQQPGPQRFKHGLFPHWVYDAADGRSKRIRRHLFFYDNSNDAARYAELKERLALYRLVFGQPRQQDLLDRIQQQIAADADLDRIHRELTRYMINLSPMREKAAHERARQEALALLGRPASLEELVAHVERLETERGAELEDVRIHIASLKNVVRSYLAGIQQSRHSVESAVYALSYLRDPYDVIFDAHMGLGLEDDCKLLLAVAQRIFGRTHPGERQA
ncbi:helicase-related protein [Anaeromyxobacter sp. Fw109-5]|uniref:helicase-related protein n=1 Tax=Anaeromyxobacter sp. (strain Fw109-5) TaxID=404589 RepID=UPI000158A834|nr:helicase-related protein [Anaeromyxobacter sp. Fw109-5]ABS28170.1 helicase domain protein [Anaeromyxobacter sp. Fw109-5]